MKSKANLLLAGILVGLLANHATAQQQIEAGATAKDQPTTTNTNSPATAIATPEAKATTASGTNGPTTATAKTTAAASGSKDLRLNFRGVPLEMVLNHLSDAAGFIIVLETEVKGKVDLWSNQPVTRDEAVVLLNSVLNRNGYAAIRSDRTLTIVSRDEAKKRDIPVRSGSDPLGIPKNDDVVTQIIPVRYINATQLIKDLQPLLPTQANLTANEGGNALVLTDSQINIKRMAEIIKALDTSVASSSIIRVYPLKYADSKALAAVVKELFPSTDTARSGAGGGGGGGGGPAAFFNQFRGGGGGGGGRGAGGGAADANGGRPGATRVVATSDDRSNSLVISAPEEVLPMIDELVKSVDTTVEDETELRVFRLQYADPVEMADILSSLFPDETQSNGSQGQSQVNFRGGPFGGGFGGFNRQGGNNNASPQNERLKAKGKVVAVPDQRTSSVIVSASRNLMTQIGEMILNLDNNPAKKQKVFVYSLENAEVQGVEQILQNLFQGNNSRNNNINQNQNGSALNNRANNLQGSTLGNGTSGAFGNSSSGRTTGR